MNHRAGPLSSDHATWQATFPARKTATTYLRRVWLELNDTDCMRDRQKCPACRGALRVDRGTVAASMSAPCLATAATSWQASTLRTSPRHVDRPMRAATGRSIAITAWVKTADETKITRLPGVLPGWHFCLSLVVPSSRSCVAFAQPAYPSTLALAPSPAPPSASYFHDLANHRLCNSPAVAPLPWRRTLRHSTFASESVDLQAVPELRNNRVACPG